MEDPTREEPREEPTREEVTAEIDAQRLRALVDRDVTRPRPGKTAFIVAVAALVIASVIAVWEARLWCGRQVYARDADRSMWVWVTDALPGNELAIEGRAVLDDRLPPLECVGITPTPRRIP